MDDSTQSDSFIFSWKWSLAVVGILVLATAIFNWALFHKKHVWTNDAYIDGYQVSITPDIEARLIELYVDEGDSVHTGQLLCRLDESIFNAQKFDAETNVFLLKEEVRLHEVRVQKLQDIYSVALAEYENEIISFLAFDKIEKDYRYAQARLNVAKANLENGIAKLGVIEELLRHTLIYAPRDGVIAKRWVVAGDALKIGQPIFSLTDRHVWVTANFEETKIEHLRPGDPVEIHVDAYPERNFQGSVFVVRGAAASQFALIPPDNATGNFTKVVQRLPVKIFFKDLNVNDLYLYPGMSVEVSVKIR